MGATKTPNWLEFYRRIKRTLAPLVDPPKWNSVKDGDLGLDRRIELKNEMQSCRTSSRLGSSAQRTCPAGGLESLSASARPNQNVSCPRPTVNLQRPTFRDDLSHARAGHKSFRPNDEQFDFETALLNFSESRTEDKPPDGTLAVPLLRHQRIALSWMVNKETRNPWFCGGILADDQGLGKTISTIALILKERPPSRRVSATITKQTEAETLDLDDDDDTNTSKGTKSIKNACLVNRYSATVAKPSVHAKGRAAGGTLIVCPTSVLRQWSEELRNKVDNKANLSVLVYHGCNRTKDPFELANYDVVLTTYSTVSMEFPKKPLVDEGTDGELLGNLSRPLGRVSWFRVVLDEAQSIKNYKTRVAKACCRFRAKRRWCLSGTPIQNAIDDLYSYFRFLRFKPYSSYNNFCSLLKVPIQICPTLGYRKLQAVLRTIMLRRIKGTYIEGEPVITLPPKRVELKKVEFTQREREFYRRIEAGYCAQFAKYASAGAVKRNYMNILQMLTRLHLACNHPHLVEKSDSSSVLRTSIEIPQHYRFGCSYESSKIKAALEVLQSLSKSRDGNSPKCEDELGSCNQETKIAGEKALVFSQWTGMLDLLEDCLKRSSIQYRRLDGTMTVVARDRAVKDFKTIPEVSVMIMSLKAASLGLNLVVASHVIILDPWWNPTTEDQAIDRAHRIGQCRPVTVLRLTVKDTVEDRILAIQEKKRQMVASAFGEEDNDSRQTRLTMEDLEYLFRYKARD